MTVDFESVNHRWQRIRTNEACDLALDAASVRKNLTLESESELVKMRILESLSQLADRRISNKKFCSDEPPGTGDMVTCEGVETFLVPLVEEALTFNRVLDFLAKNSVDTQALSDALVKDIKELVDNWTVGKFLADPYSSDVKSALEPDKKRDFEVTINQRRELVISITESAAMACRIAVHLLTLKLGQPDTAFCRSIGNLLEDDKLLKSLSNAIQFMVDSFQKGPGDTVEQQIANATTDDKPGSGWSWTARQGLSPMLFFTAAAVDAFAELDLYLMRPATTKWETGSPDQKKLFTYYTSIKDMLDKYQFCVDMARRWVLHKILPGLSQNEGLQVESKEKSSKSYVKYKSCNFGSYEGDLKRENLLDEDTSPLYCYNSLYGLQIMLWSWGDWNDAGEDYDANIKNQINSAIALLISNYNIPVVRDVLRRFPNEFYLPRGNILRGAESCTYLDFGFLPLLARLLVLFLVYGAGDRLLLEPVIRALYIELLQNRNRKDENSRALWSRQNVEIFSTQRAVQALTFYRAYAEAREKLEAGQSQRVGPDGITFRNQTGLELVFDIVAAREAGSPRPAEPKPPPPPPYPDTFEKWAEEKKIGYNKKIIDVDGGEEFIQRIRQVGDKLLENVRARRILNREFVDDLLERLGALRKEPALPNDGGLKQEELNKLERIMKDQLQASTSRRGAAAT